MVLSGDLCALALVRLDTEGIDLLCALLQVGHRSLLTPPPESLNPLTVLWFRLQFDTRSRTSAEAALRHSYFLSLGENIHHLPDSEFTKLHLQHSDLCDSWSVSMAANSTFVQFLCFSRVASPIIQQIQQHVNVSTSFHV